MPESHDMREPTHLATGAIGEPGNRVFYIQAGDDHRRISLKLEKQQVVALAQFLRSVLDDLPSPVGELPAADLIEPVEPDWIVGQIAVGVDEADAEIVLMVEELVPLDEDDDRSEDLSDPLDDVSIGSTLRVHIDASRAASFVAKADALVAKSRPPCRLCGQPQDGRHVCPRLN
jgi:uncharacterized repeat protein (TIGR03847 family)